MIKVLIMMMIIIITIIMIIIVMIPGEQKILGSCSAGHSLISWVERSSLALVGNPSRDHVSIKILIVMECYLLSEPKIREYRKRMLSLWLQKDMFWVSEQRLVNQANTIRRNSWMTELAIEEL